MWRKLPDFRAEKKTQSPVTSVAVMAFSVLSEKPFQNQCWTCGPKVVGAGGKFPKVSLREGAKVLLDRGSRDLSRVFV